MTVPGVLSFPPGDSSAAEESSSESESDESESEDPDDAVTPGLLSPAAAAGDDWGELKLADGPAAAAAAAANGKCLRLSTLLAPVYQQTIVKTIGKVIRPV